MPYTIAILVALGLFIYGAVIPLGRIAYAMNIEQHSDADLCGWTPGATTRAGRCRNR
jgi:hypothetical protein